MKKFILLLLLISSTSIFAQSFMYTHVADASNIVANLTKLDHPMLNDNPDAKLVATHNYSVNNQYNDHVTGAFYNSGTGFWFLFNEDTTPMLDEAAFNIYIAQSNEIITHISTPANQGNGPNSTLIDDPLLNNNFGRLVFITNYYNPNQVANNINYGVFYNDIADRRGIYTEVAQPIPNGAAFFVLVSGVETNVITWRHQATETSTVNNWTVIDQPFLNGNPDAIFIAQHYFGVLANSDINHDHTIGVWYNPTTERWNVYNEDLTDMPDDIVFDLIIFDPALGVEENNAGNIAIYPNPATDMLTLSNSNNTELKNIIIYDLLGKEVLRHDFDTSNSEKTINIASLTVGTYLVKILSNSGSVVKKLIKK